MNVVEEQMPKFPLSDMFKNKMLLFGDGHRERIMGLLYVATVDKTVIYTERQTLVIEPES